jgi:hypothetical protein
MPPTFVATLGQAKHIASRMLRQKLSVSEVTRARSAGDVQAVALLRDGSPQITVQPWNRTVPPGGNASIGAKAVGMQFTSYQWQFNETVIAGATNDTYSITNTQPADTGMYNVLISNEVGVVVRHQAKLLVSAAVPPNTNQPPVLPVQTVRTIDELSTLVVVNTVTDSVPASALNYQLLNPPSGAIIDSTGIIRWTPSDAQASSTVVITTLVSDNGTPSLSATNSFTVVSELH